jgi:hypothetical protein
MVPNGRENNERPTRPEPEQIRIPRRSFSRKSVGGKAPRKTAARVNGREIRRLVIEAHRQEQQQQQQQQAAQQNEETSSSEEMETTAASGTTETETKVVLKFYAFN